MPKNTLVKPAHRMSKDIQFTITEGKEKQLETENVCKIIDQSSTFKIFADYMN